jgi:DNA-binding CsgD family transcriptional regulator
VPAELRVQIDDFHRAGEVAERVRAETATARSRAAVALIESGLTLREAAAILDISHQRVKQLVDHATTT